MIQHVIHPIQPIYDQNSRILILGSFPSVKSREVQFFYGHPQNRFWPLLAQLKGENIPETIPEKQAFLIRSQIAVWDVIKSCDITGSSDSSIRNAVPNDLSCILNTADIRAIYTNGGVSHKLYEKYIFPKTSIPDIRLPSTSPANAAFSMERLIKEWSCIQVYFPPKAAN